MKNKKLLIKLITATLLSSVIFVNCQPGSKLTDNKMTGSNIASDSSPSRLVRTLTKAGNYTVTFRLKMLAPAQSIMEADRLIVRDYKSKEVIAYRKLESGDFNVSSVDVDLYFETKSPGQVVFEIEKMNSDIFSITEVFVHGESLSMEDLWQGKAHFSFVRDDNWSTGTGLFEYEGHTASMVVLDGRWFAFNRRHLVNYTPESRVRPGTVLIELVVRESLDYGQTWSEPVVVARPTGKENDGDGEMVVDSGAFFDAETNTWHIMSQCMAMDRKSWNMCHYYKRGTSPMGLFEKNVHNPVVVDNQLFSTICKDSQICHADTIYEGTPQILFKKDDYFFVTFHGARNMANRAIDSIRGIAKTKDFVNWVTVADDLPNDALVSPQDCNKWGVDWTHGGCVGIGSASILRSGGYNYMLAEGMDTNLVCEAGQNWVFGLMRSPTLSASGTWEPFRDHAFLISGNEPDTQQGGCQLQYMNLFRIRGRTFMTFAIRNPQQPNYFHYKYKTYELKSGAQPAGPIVAK